MHNLSLQNQYNHITRKFVLISKIYFKVYTYLNYCSKFFLIFWFCPKGNQVYYTWITYTSVLLLVNIQLLFFHCMKYAEIQTCSNVYPPVCGQNRFRIFLFLDRIPISVQIWENADAILVIYRKMQVRESLYLDLFHAGSCRTLLVIT